MSLQVIVVAVIALVVLVVLIVMMTGKTKIFGSATTDCGSKGGQCVVPVYADDSGTPSCGVGYAKMFGAKCEAELLCCSKMDE